MTFPEKSDDMIGRYFSDIPTTELMEKREISERFTTLMGCVILLNCVQIGAECQWSRDSFMAPIYTACDFIFVTIYITEILLKFHKLGLSYFFCDTLDQFWNLIDFTLTVLMVVEMVLEHMCKVSHFATAARQLLLLRFVRLFRILRILRSVPELSLLLEGLVTSWTRLSWIVSLLALLIYIFGIFFTIEADDRIFEEEGYFENLFASMSTLLNVIIGAEWMAIADPILRKQPHLMIPLLAFLIVGSFGILNCIVGVIVDATADSKKHFELAERFQQLHKLSNMWVEKTESAGLGEKEIMRFRSGHLREKRAERKLLILEVLDEIIKSETVKFPAGTSAHDLYDVIDDNGNGDISHEEFVLGMGQLLLADQFQLTCQQSISLAKVRRMGQKAEQTFESFSEGMGDFQADMQSFGQGVVAFQTEMRERMSKIEEQLEKLVSGKKVT